MNASYMMQHGKASRNSSSRGTAIARILHLLHPQRQHGGVGMPEPEGMNEDSAKASALLLVSRFSKVQPAHPFIIHSVLLLTFLITFCAVGLRE